jgi:HEAT repeat protein
MPALDARILEYEELVAAKNGLVAAELILSLRDGREIVRANAALGLAAIGHATPELVPFLRDGDLRVALATAKALVQLGVAYRAQVVSIAAALDGARIPVVETVQQMFAQLVGTADAELVSALDTGNEVIVNSIVRACEQVGVRGLHLLQAAARDDRARVRINALRGISQIGDLELESSIDTLTGVEQTDQVADVRAAARIAMMVLKARVRALLGARRKIAPPPPLAFPALVDHALTAAELKDAAKGAPLDELLLALEDPRTLVRTNALRVFAEKASGAASSAAAIAVLLRDRERSVRLEAVNALGTLGMIAAPALVRALGDQDPEVVAAAEAAVGRLGETASSALADGLDTSSEAHGVRVATILGRLANGPTLLVAALRSTSIDVRIHAAHGLASVGRPRVDLRALATTSDGGNARLRAATSRALAALDPQPDRRPPRIAVAGFYERALVEKDITAVKDVAALAAHLGDANPIVRANAALALGTLGDAALPTSEQLAVGLRDDAPEVRLAAARALDRIGDAAVAITIADLLAALRDGDDALAAQVTQMIQARKHAAIDAALINSLATSGRYLALVATLPAAVDILCEAFARGHRNATRGFVLLGRERIGKGRKLLEEARATGSASLRELARTALQAIDGPPATPQIPAIAGFETTLLAPAAITGKLAAADLVGLLRDGRAIVRANAATALGTLGATAAPLAPLLRDDDRRVRIAAIQALDKLGDEALIAAAPDLVGALRGDNDVAEACRAVLAARGTKVQAALVAGLETPDEQHGTRIAGLISALPNAREILFIAFDGPAQNVQLNAAIGIGLLGVEKAGLAGWRRLRLGMAGPFTRRREVMVKALAMLGPEPT